MVRARHRTIRLVASRIHSLKPASFLEYRADTVSAAWSFSFRLLRVTWRVEFYRLVKALQAVEAD
jgi:hypothetical protein